MLLNLAGGFEPVAAENLVTRDYQPMFMPEAERHARISELGDSELSRRSVIGCGA